jgi:SAM-dependent methyltransferase
MNRAHWEATLDAQNLRTDGTAGPPPEVLVDLAHTADIRRALRHLAPLDGRWAVDIGGGIGLVAALLARRGARVIIADLSVPRLREARRLLDRLGLAGRVRFVACAAEQLPFRTASIDRVITKSVLIHTRVEASVAAIARILAPRGRAAIVEPTTGNPLVNLYRRLAAPGIWAKITEYFGEPRLAAMRRQLRAAGLHVRDERLYLLAFLATPLNFTLHWPRAYRLAETALLALDRTLLTLAPHLLRPRCWFALLLIRRGHDHPRQLVEGGGGDATAPWGGSCPDPQPRRHR